MASLPSDLQDVLNQFDALDRQAETIVSPLNDEQFHWQPDQGRAWSIALCIEHLATSNRVYGDPMRSALDTARSKNLKRKGPIASTIFGRMFISNLEPPVKRRMRAPSKIIPPSGGTRTDILARYHDTHEQIRQMIRECADVDANRATFTNPFISLVRVRVGTAFHILAAHDRRHLWQAEQVVRAPGFPPGQPRVSPEQT